MDKLGPAPDDLNTDEALVWNEAIMLNEELTAADSYILEAFCRQMVRWRKLAKPTRRKKEIPPLKDAWLQLLGTMTKMGMTPKDRKIIQGASTKPAKRKSKLQERWE